MRAVILSAGSLQDVAAVRAQIGRPDLVICADGGIHHASVLEIAPDLVIGDFDSADPALLNDLVARGAQTLRFPVAKDQTDTHLALQEAIGRGATEILLIGATGDRLDHTLANLLLLPDVSPEVAVVISDGKNCIRLLCPGGQLTVEGAPGDLLSLLPLSPRVEGVTAQGVAWPLEGAVLRWGESVGVSNRLVEAQAHVAIQEGYLLVISTRDEPGGTVHERIRTDTVFG